MTWLDGAGMIANDCMDCCDLGGAGLNRLDRNMPAHTFAARRSGERAIIAPDGQIRWQQLGRIERDPANHMRGCLLARGGFDHFVELWIMCSLLKQHTQHRQIA